jgi:hypothetical protein
MLSHRVIILNRSLSQLSPQENHLENHLKPKSTESIGVQRQETTHRLNSVQRRMIHLSHGHTHHMGSLTGRLNSVQRRTYHGECHMTLQSSTLPLIYRGILHHAKSLTEVLELHSGKRFGEDICNLIMCRNVLHVY